MQRRYSSQRIRNLVLGSSVVALATLSACGGAVPAIPPVAPAVVAAHVSTPVTGPPALAQRYYPTSSPVPPAGFATTSPADAVPVTSGQTYGQQLATIMGSSETTLRGVQQNGRLLDAAPLLLDDATWLAREHRLLGELTSEGNALQSIAPVPDGFASLNQTDVGIGKELVLYSWYMNKWIVDQDSGELDYANAHMTQAGALIDQATAQAQNLTTP